MEKLEVEKIETHDTLGNQVLYDLCKKHMSNSISEFVSAKTWLIGRSYAVSPQRRKIPNKGISSKYNFFFEDFSKIFTSNTESCNRIDEFINQVNSMSFCGDFEIDKKNIINILKLISIFNNHVVNTIVKLDNLNSTNEAKQNISFTSKYLHFHCPNCIYIFDSYSNANARSFIQSYKKQLHIDKIIKEVRDEIKDENANDYIAHFIRCYFISTFCFNSTPTPRQLDNALLSEYVK